jgi:hypothetical protein
LSKKDNPDLKALNPHHHRVVPEAAQITISQMEAAIRSVADSPVSVFRLQRGQVIRLDK